MDLITGLLSLHPSPPLNFHLSSSPVLLLLPRPPPPPPPPWSRTPIIKRSGLQEPPSTPPQTPLRPSPQQLPQKKKRPKQPKHHPKRPPPPVRIFPHLPSSSKETRRIKQKQANSKQASARMQVNNKSRQRRVSQRLKAGNSPNKGGLRLSQPKKIHGH